MKKTTYECDRCHAALLNPSEVFTVGRLSTGEDFSAIARCHGAILRLQFDYIDSNANHFCNDCGEALVHELAAVAVDGILEKARQIRSSREARE